MISPSQLSQTFRRFMDLAMQYAVQERSQLAKGIGISMPQLGILMQLNFHGSCGISDLGNRFDITSAAASQLVDKLVQNGLIQREEDPQDRRAKVLTLTEKGKEVIQQHAQRRYRWIEDIAQKLSAQECDQINEALNMLSQALQEHETEPKPVQHPA